MTLFSDAKGRKIVDLATANTIGTVDDYVVDTAHQKLAAIVMKKSTSAGNLVAWDKIASFGSDAVTVDDESAISRAEGSLAELTVKSNTFDGKQILSAEGELLGSVDDIDFDPNSGVLNHVVRHAGEPIAGNQLIATGSFAVIVRG
jgi:uncharacterized protein YrrD